MVKNTRQIISRLLSVDKHNLIFITNRYYVRWQHRQPKKVYANENELEAEISKKKHTNIVQENENRCKILRETQKNIKNVPNFDSFDINLKDQIRNNFSQKTNEKNNQFPNQTNSVTKELNQDNNNLNDNITFNNSSNDDSDCVETVKINKGNISFEKLEHNDRKLNKLMTMVKLRKHRERKNIVLLEGKRLIRDALLANCIPEIILFSRITDLDSFKELLLNKNVQFYKVPYKDLQLWSPLTTCPGIMGIFKIPDTSERLETVNNSLPITVICDNVREPGNLGTIIRTAAAAGCQKLLLTKGCVDIWEPKVLRSACGAHFRLTIEPNLNWSDINFKFKNPSVFIADNNTETCISLEFSSCSYDNIHFINQSEVALIIGGETCGISQDAYHFAKNFVGMRIHIPLENGVESLNTGAALAVIIFEMRRQIQSLEKAKLTNNYQVSSI